MTAVSTDLMKKIRRMEIRTRYLVSEIFAGEYLSIFKGRGIEFDEVRLYAPGDDVRSIDWNVTARTGDTYIKRYVEERELTLMLVVDASASNDFGTVSQFKRDAIAELSAILSFAATTNNDKVGLLVFTDQIELFIPPRKGRKHVLRIIREILAFEPKGKGTDINVALERINQVLKRRGIVFLISDFLTDPEGFRRAINLTSKRHDLVAIEVSDPLETEMAKVGLVTIEDAETGEVMGIDTANSLWQRNFREFQEEFTAQKKYIFNSAKVDHVVVQTPDDIAGVLLKFFQKRALRARR